MMAAGLRSTAVAAGRIILLSAGFGGLGAAIAPTDWPTTTNAYNMHEMSPAMGYASWGVVIVLGLQTARRLIQSMRAPYGDWTPAILALCFLFALCAAGYGTLPYRIYDDPSYLIVSPSPVTFGD